MVGNVMIDTLVRLLPVHVAGRLLLAVILLLNLAGVLVLHRAWFGHLANVTREIATLGRLEAGAQTR